MKRRILAFSWALALVLLISGSAAAGPKFVAAVNADQSAPIDRSDGRGVCTASVRPRRTQLEVNCDFWNLSGSIVRADIYFTSDGDSVPLCTLTAAPAPSGPITQTCQPPYGFPSWSESLLNRDLEVLVTTANYPQGEIRGRFKVVMLDSDVDGDGRADPTVFRPASNMSYAFSTLRGTTVAQQFPGYYWENRPLAADFDGDGMVDLASCHIDWNTGEWLWIYTRSSDHTMTQTSWGNEWLNDQEAYADFDGDGRMDIAVFRQDSGSWYISQSSDGQTRYEQWGMLGDRAVPADYDMDGKADLAIVREEAGQLAWYIHRSSDNTSYRVQWGLASDTIFPDMPVDVDADGASDIIVARNSIFGAKADPETRTFYVLRSSDQNLVATQWGLATDDVRLGDFDGDGRTDYAAIRPIDGHLVWFVSSGEKGSMSVFNWGLTGDE